ncbi:transposase [Rhizobium leguminosarum]|nr:transposase [Rhizobium leguminosarum]
MPAVALTTEQLHWILDGIDIDAIRLLCVGIIRTAKRHGGSGSMTVETLG